MSPFIKPAVGRRVHALARSSDVYELVRQSLQLQALNGFTSPCDLSSSSLSAGDQPPRLQISTRSQECYDVNTATTLTML